MQKNKEIVLTTQMRGDTQTEKWGRDVEALTVAFYIETRCRSRTNCKLFFFFGFIQVGWTVRAFTHCT